MIQSVFILQINHCRWLVPSLCFKQKKCLPNARLDAYYRWIHIYMPLLPPPLCLHTASDDSLPCQADAVTLVEESTSPLKLAISAVLALIPLESVTNPSRPSHVALRRKTAHHFAQRSLSLMEDETDMPQDLSPSSALAHSMTAPQRQLLHPQVPIELESVLSLCLLAIYEYSQRGNIRKMQDRAGQALVSAMNLSLHNRADDTSCYAEARRRAWWMTVGESSMIDRKHTRSQ